MQAAKRYVKMRAAIFIYAAIPVFLFGCAGTGSPPGSYLQIYGLSAEPRRASFDVCRSIGCEKTGRALLSEAEWAEVRSLFTPPSTDPRKERARAARAVGLLAEWFVPWQGSMCDAAANELLSPLPEIDLERARAVRARDLGPGWVDPGPGCDVPRNEFGPPRTAQLDCIAETSNTTTFLLLLERDKLLSRHRVRYPAHRGFLIWSSHNTAVLEELATGRLWAIDSWYGPKGSPAPVWPLDLWQSGEEGQSNCENAGDLVPNLLSGRLPLPHMLQSE